MTNYADVRRQTLKHWKTRSKRIVRVSDNFSKSIECNWQNKAQDLGYSHVSIFCSIGQFASHITDLLRDYRFDKYEFDQSEEVNELIFRFYSRILLIASEIFTDFQDLYIIADQKITTKNLGGIKGATLKAYQDNARTSLAKGNKDIKDILDYINKICKHKTSNLHICNNHIHFLFQDFHKNIAQRKQRIELGKINQFTSYDPNTFITYQKPSYIVVPKLGYIISLIIDGYEVLNDLFENDTSKFEFICKHYENL